MSGKKVAREYKWFIEYDNPRYVSSFRHWLLHGWHLSEQVGFRVLGLYVNLMWRNKQ